MFAHLARARGWSRVRPPPVGGAATGSRSTTAGSHQHDDGLRTCARSRFSGWRVGALYPLARGCRAPRRMMADGAAEFLFGVIEWWPARRAAAAVFLIANLGGAVGRPRPLESQPTR